MVLMASLMGLASAAVILVGASRAFASGPSAEPIRYTVRDGDTVWSIARAHQPEGDIRPFVRSLGAQVGRGSLQPGAILSVTVP